MAFVALSPPMVWPEALEWGANGVPAMQTVLMDAAAEKAAWVFRSPRAGNIAKIGFRVDTVSGTANNLDARVETVDGSGHPSGTLWNLNGTGANPKATITPTASTWFWADLTDDAIVLLGEPVALVIAFTAFSGTPVITINSTTTNMGRTTGMPYSDSFTGAGPYAKLVTYPNFAVEWSDGTRSYIVSGPHASVSEINTASGVTPEEFGNRFVLPFRAKCVGAMFRGGDPQYRWDLAIYASPYGSVSTDTIAYQDWDSDFQSNGYPPGSTDNTAQHILWDTPANEAILEAYTMYRIVAWPQAGSTIRRVEMVLDSAASMEAHGGGADFHKTHRIRGNSGVASANVTTTDTTLTDTGGVGPTNRWIGAIVSCNGKTMTVTGNNANTVAGTGWSGGGNPGNGFAWLIDPPWTDTPAARTAIYPILSAIDTAVAPINIGAAQVI